MTPLTSPPAQQSQEPPASSPSATWVSPTTPASLLTSFLLRGAAQAPMRMEPTFLAVSRSAHPLVPVPRLQQQQPPQPLPPQQFPLPQPLQCPPQLQQQPQPQLPPPRPPQLQLT